MEKSRGHFLGNKSRGFTNFSYIIFHKCSKKTAYFLDHIFCYKSTNLVDKKAKTKTFSMALRYFVLFADTILFIFIQFDQKA